MDMIKHELPFIWLDTSNFINFSKARKGMLEDYDYERYKEVFNTVYDLVYKNKLVCLMGEQDSEFRDKDFEFNLSFLRVLCKNVKMGEKHRIKFRQIEKAIRDFINEESFTIEYQDVVKFSDIENSLYMDRNGYSNPFENDFRLQFEYINETNFNPYRIKYKEKMKQFNLSNDLKEKMKKNTFQSQFSNETLGLKQAWECVKNEPFLPPYTDISDIVSIWKTITGLNTSDEKWEKFIVSSSWNKIPVNDIKNKLTSRMLQPGINHIPSDIIDIENISAYLPYMDAMLLDNSMKNHVKKLGLDKEYDTKVFSMKEYEDFIVFLQDIS